MKNILRTIACALPLLAACSKSSDTPMVPPVVPPAGQAAISFDGAQTRAPLHTAHATFGLFGSATADNATAIVFQNQRVDYNATSTSWLYSPLKYWNQQADHRFAAYAPFNASHSISVTPEGHSLVTNFVVQQNVEQQESLLLSHPVERNVGAGGLDMSAVTFTFNPVLTRVNFRIKKDATVPGTVRLSALRMYNLKSSGNCTHNGSQAAWDTSSAPNNAFGYSTGFTTTPEVTLQGITAWPDGALMIPQPVTGISVYLSYTHRTADLTYTYDKSNIALPGANWQPGQQITYVLTLKPENYVEIGEPIVEPWIEGASGGGTIIIN